MVRSLLLHPCAPFFCIYLPTGWCCYLHQSIHRCRCLPRALCGSCPWCPSPDIASSYLRAAQDNCGALPETILTRMFSRRRLRMSLQEAMGYLRKVALSRPFMRLLASLGPSPFPSPPFSLPPLPLDRKTQKCELADTCLCSEWQNDLLFQTRSKD